MLLSGAAVLADDLGSILEAKSHASRQCAALDMEACAFIEGCHMNGASTLGIVKYNGTWKSHVQSDQMKALFRIARQYRKRDNEDARDALTHLCTCQMLPLMLRDARSYFLSNPSFASAEGSFPYAAIHLTQQMPSSACLGQDVNC